jgi:hypothetical protein
LQVQVARVIAGMSRASQLEANSDVLERTMTNILSSVGSKQSDKDRVAVMKVFINDFKGF